VQDYLSLLVSRDSPKLADTTLSPYAKQHKLQGTLGYDKWPLPDPDSSEERKAELVAKGWRMKGLESAADNVLNAATRLETEVRKETQYWEQVLSIAQKGWSLRRIARDGHRPILGVQFGFSEGS
jgi:mediator of RNA polymerase II transcription subunit 17